MRPCWLAFAALALVACAAPAPQPQPTDFPLHQADQIFDLHWKLDRGAASVRANGVVAARQGSFSSVILELIGMDRSGKVVSRGLTVVRTGFQDEPQPQPFSAELQPSGQEERFELKVATYTLKSLQSER